MVKTEHEKFGAVGEELAFSTQQFPARRALRLMAMLMKQVGPLLAALGGIDDEMPLETQIATIVPALNDGLMGLDPELADKLVLEILACTSVIMPNPDRQVAFSGPRAGDNLDNVFSGELGTLMRVVAWVLKVNFSNFNLGGAVAPSAPADEPSEK